MNRKVVSAIAGFMALTMGVYGVPAVFGNFAVSTPFAVSAAETMRDISSAELVKDMGIGWNLGNTFDSICSWITNGTPDQYETGWGNPVVTKSVIQKVKASGFKTIRIPVTWINCMDTTTNKVSDAWMARIKEVVDWCIDEGLYVIINVHHDGGSAETSWIKNASSDYATVSKRFESLWTQIATQFADYSDYLIFEGMNEVEFSTVTKTEAYNIMNKLNQLFVDTVRKSGGNNAKRHLLVSGYNTDISLTSDSRFVMPEDPEGKLILSLHYYSPPQFCVAESNVDWCTPQTTWGTADDYAALEADMAKIYKNFISKGIPVIIGEYGVLTEQENNKDKASIRKFLAAVSETALSYGMCPVLWDSGTSGDMKYIDRNNVAFNDSEIEKIYSDISAKYASGQIVEKNPQITTYDEKKVSIPSDGWITLGSDKSKLVGIRFNISCSTSWDSQGGGGINYADNWDDCLQFGFNSVYDTVEVIFTDSQRQKLADKIGVFFWWTLLDNANDENSGHASELSFKNGEITLLFESSVPAVTTVTTTKPVPVTTTAVTTTVAETTTTIAIAEAVKGDVDENGSVTASDIVALMQALIGKIELSDIQMKSADMNGDGKLSIIDLIKLKNFILEK